MWPIQSAAAVITPEHRRRMAEKAEDEAKLYGLRSDQIDNTMLRGNLRIVSSKIRLQDKIEFDPSLD